MQEKKERIGQNLRLTAVNDLEYSMFMSPTRLSKVTRSAWVGMALALALLTFRCDNLDAKDVSAAEFAVTNTECLKDCSRIEANQSRSLRLEGIITEMDYKRGLLVLQDAKGVAALHSDSFPGNLRPGQKIRLESDNVAGWCMPFPEFPLHPTGTEYLTSLAAPTNFGVYYLARIHGFVIPPMTGDYRFWIASKMSSEFWFSTNADSSGLRRIAFVPDGRSASPEQWDKFPSQVSDPIHLDAGQPYLFDVMHEHRAGRDDTVAVAWEGPGITRAVIDGKFLVPYADRNTNGAIHEHWDNCFLASVQPLTAGRMESPEVAVTNPRIEVLGESPFPDPIPVEIGADLSPTQDFRWAEVQAIVEFAAQGADDLTLVLAKDHARLELKFPPGAKLNITDLIGTCVRAQGVCEAAIDESGNRVVGVIRVPSEKEFSKIGFDAGSVQKPGLISIGDLYPANPALAYGRRIRIRGTVLRQDSNTLVIQGAARFCGYVSTNGTEWKPAAPAVDISMHGSALSGLLVSSLNSSELATARFDSVNGVDSSAGDMEISAASPAGKTDNHPGGEILVQGGGTGFGTLYEEVHFYGGQLSARNEVVARINSLQSNETNSVAGIMVRDSADAHTSFVSLTVSSGGSAAFHFRQRRGERDEAINLPDYSIPCWVKLTRTFPTIEVSSDQSISAAIGEAVELGGSLQWNGTNAFLAYARRLDEPSPARSRVPDLETADAPVPIRIAQVVPERNEGLREGSGAISVRGVVTFNGSAFGTNYLIIQDDTGAGLVRLTARFTRKNPGVRQLLELQTRSQNGKWPFPLDPNQMQVIGPAQMPEPLSLAAANTQVRRGEFRWVECRGIVREIAGNNELKLVSSSGEIPVWVSDATPARMNQLVDALVQIHGVLVYRENKASLLVPSLACAEVMEAAPDDPFSVPEVAIDQLPGFSRLASTCHRIKISGMVTGRNDQLLVVQDDSGGVWVNAAVATNVLVGDSVEVVGFPDGHAGSCTLSAALVRKTGNAHMPMAAMISSEELYSGSYSGQLIQLRGELLGQKMDNGGPVLEIQSGQRVFRAEFLDRQSPVKSIPVGSLVQVTGISWPEHLGTPFSIAGDSDSSVASFAIFMRTPGDVAVLQWPPWWAWKHATLIIGTLGIVLVAAMLWIRYLRLKVERRTQQLNEAMDRLERETETSATLAERNRLAGEIHDGLEQGLSAVMMQLDGLESKLASDPADVARHLELARKMVRFSRTEVRHSLWDWKSPALADKGLAGALADIVNHMRTGNETQVTVEVSGNGVPLPAAIEHHLLRIAQEALNNALKYAAATSININLEYGASLVRLSVRDNGRGFDPGAALSGAEGHFGLQNLRSRTRKMGGTLKIDSAPAKGTIIEAAAPITAAAPKPGDNGQNSHS